MVVEEDVEVDVAGAFIDGFASAQVVFDGLKGSQEGGWGEGGFDLPGPGCVSLRRL